MLPAVHNSSGCISAYALSYLPSQLVWRDLPASAGHWRGSEWRFHRDPTMSVTLTLHQTWLTDREGLGYVDPGNVPSPRLLYHHCTAGAHNLRSSAKNWCVFVCALLLYPCCGVGCAWWNTHANCDWLVLLTLESDWALERDPTTSIPLTLHLHSLLQGKRVTYITETFSIASLHCLLVLLCDFCCQLISNNRPT